MEDILYKLPTKKIESTEKSKLLIVITENENASDKIDFLKAIVKALKIDFDSDCVLIPTAPNDYNVGKALVNFDHAIIFGLTPIEVAINTGNKLLKVMRFEHRNVLFCENLKAIQSDQTKKAQLWKILQQMFGLI
jgi:hypothetical protein